MVVRATPHFDFTEAGIEVKGAEHGPQTLKPISAHSFWNGLSGDDRIRTCERVAPFGVLETPAIDRSATSE